MKYIIFLIDDNYSEITDSQLNLLLKKIKIISSEVMAIIVNEKHHNSGIACLLDQLKKSELITKAYQELNLAPDEEKVEVIFEIIGEIFVKNNSEWKSVICILPKESIIKFLNYARSMDKNLTGTESAEKLILGNIGVAYFNKQNKILNTGIS